MGFPFEWTCLFVFPLWLYIYHGPVNERFLRSGTLMGVCYWWMYVPTIMTRDNASSGAALMGKIAYSYSLKTSHNPLE